MPNGTYTDEVGMALPSTEPRAEIAARTQTGLEGNLDVSLAARVLAALFAAGATLALLTAALPHPRRANELGVLAIVAIAYCVAGALLWLAGRLPFAALAIALACGSTQITAVAYFSGQRPSPLIFFYLWVFLYSAYFFAARQIVAQMTYVGALYGMLLAVRPPPGAIPAWWLVGMGTLAVAARLVCVMRERAEQLIARLYDASRTDPLTSLSNRRGFRELLDLELARARRAGARMSVIVGDLDGFKEVNDRSGAQVGDAALKRVARTLERAKREIDGLARVGGEEFALLLPDTSEHNAFAIAERLRDDVREEFRDSAVPVTISFGVASYPMHGETAAALLRATDEALQAAKWNGRDRTMLHSPAMRSAQQPDGGTRDIVTERFLAVMLDLAEAIDLRFSGSARHSETVGRYAEMMARELGLSEQRTSRVRLAGLLHDIGKVSVPDRILQKPGELTDDELVVIRRHPGLGAQMLDDPSLADICAWVEAHHERPDGRGYPHGLAGEEIPLEARILAVADAYEAMTSDRSYRPSLSSAAARIELERCAGAQFDPRVVRALLTLLEREPIQAEAALARV
jgi:diguanylate cyclase (GGDEF)-like protein/putative nucleotidyltransferase with HDIG domain